MPAILGLLIPALIPAVADGIRGVINKFTGGAGANPANVAEAVQLMNAETERLKVVAALDNPGGTPAQWVINLRASTRYIMGLAIIGGTLLLIASLQYAPPKPEQKDAAFALVEMMLQLSGSVFAFFFGDRVYLSLKGGKR